MTSCVCHYQFTVSTHLYLMVITRSCGSNYLGLIRDNSALFLHFRVVLLEILEHFLVNI